MSNLGIEFQIPRKKKLYSFILFLSLFGAIGIYNFLDENNSFSSNSGPVVLLALSIVIHYLVVLPIVIWTLLSSKPELIMGPEGIYCRKQLGLPKKRLHWELFESFSEGKKFGEDFIELKIKDQEAYLKNFPKYQIFINLGFSEAVFPMGIFPRKLGITKLELIRQLSIWLPQTPSRIS